MGDLTELQEAKVTQAQHVLMLLFYDPTLKIDEACATVGITPRQYRYWLSHGGSAIDDTRQLIDQQQRELISQIAVAKTEIIRLMIADATNELTKPLDRKALFECLDGILNEYQTIYHARPGIEEEAQEFLKHGPTLEKKESRFASIDVEKTETGFRIGLNEEKEVIDASFQENSEVQEDESQPST